MRYGAVGYPGCRAEFLLRGRFAPVCSPQLEVREPADLDHHPLLHFEWRKVAGDTILTAPFKHGYMGVLTEDTVIRTLFSKRSLPKGTLLYGVPMSRTLSTSAEVRSSVASSRQPTRRRRACSPIVGVTRIR